jgi:ATP-dependent Clp protease ATP-binding subunit ClpX
VEQRSKLDLNNLMKYVSPQDLKSFGLIPEIIGRLPVVTSLQPLDRDALRNILTEPKNSLIRQYKTMMLMDGIDFNIDNDALELIADVALKIGTGARGLRSMMESILNEFVFDLSDSSDNNREFTVTKDDVIAKINKRYSTYFEKAA